MALGIVEVVVEEEDGRSEDVGVTNEVLYAEDGDVEGEELGTTELDVCLVETEDGDLVEVPDPTVELDDFDGVELVDRAEELEVTLTQPAS